MYYVLKVIIVQSIVRSRMDAECARYSPSSPLLYPLTYSFSISPFFHLLLYFPLVTSFPVGSCRVSCRGGHRLTLFLGQHMYNAICIYVIRHVMPSGVFKSFLTFRIRVPHPVIVDGGCVVLVCLPGVSSLSRSVTTVLASRQ